MFASAHQQQTDAAIRGRRVQAGAVRAFVQNRLVVVLPQDNPSGMVSLADLARPGLRSVDGVALLLTFSRRGAIGSWLEGAGVQTAFTLSVILALVSLTAILLVKGFITTWGKHHRFPGFWKQKPDLPRLN